MLFSIILSLVLDEVMFRQKKSAGLLYCSFKTHEFFLWQGNNVAVDLTSVGKSIDPTLDDEITNDSETGFRCSKVT